MVLQPSGRIAFRGAGPDPQGARFLILTMDLRPQIEKFSRRFAEVEAALSDPKAFDNPQRAQELGKEYARLKDLVGQGHLKTVTDLAENRALLAAEPPESELAQMAKEEVARLQSEEKRLAQELQ